MASESENNAVKQAEPPETEAPSQKEKGNSSTENDDDADNDDDASSTQSEEDDSDKDTPPVRDPELLLIKAQQLKDEGNNYFKDGSYVLASRCYRRGAQQLKPLNKGNTGDEQVKSLLISLQTNLSMMFFKLEKHKQCVQVATKVLQIDSNNVKARYRRAMANRKLGEYQKARDDLREALRIDPANNAVKKELSSIKKDLETQKQQQRASMQRAFSKGALLYDDKREVLKKKQEEEVLKKKQAEEQLKKRKAEWEDECVHRMAKGEAAITFEEYEKVLKEKEQLERQRRAEARKKAKEAAKVDSDSDSDDELTEKEVAQLRGYKKTSDGRVTSYFTREQSHEEKQMIGDIAPRRLDAPSSAPSVGSGKGNASAWNQAGTWEEKDASVWCCERLKLRLNETKVESGSLVGVVTEVKDMTGDASVAVVSGKKRYIFDFHGKVVFDIRDRETEEVVANGSLKLPDICSTHHDELDVMVEAWKPPNENEVPAKECRDCLVSEVRESVKLWVTDFNNTY